MKVNEMNATNAMGTEKLHFQMVTHMKDFMKTGNEMDKELTGRYEMNSQGSMSKDFFKF
jgi:hypothetical protein